MKSYHTNPSALPSYPKHKLRQNRILIGENVSIHKMQFANKLVTLKWNLLNQ